MSWEGWNSNNGLLMKRPRKLRQDSRMLLLEKGTRVIYSEISQIARDVTSKISGDVIEVGVHAGRSALVLCESVPDTVLIHLFDTWEGLPEPTEIDDDPGKKKGQFKANFKVVRKKFSARKNVFLYKGVFPQDTSNAISDKKFAFVHLDVDWYKSTKDSLEFVYPRMSKGGAIMSHDYTTIPAVKRAFTEFFSARKEFVIPMSNSYCIVVKL